MSPDRKMFLPLLAALSLAAAACGKSEPPTVCESTGSDYTSRVTVNKTDIGEDRRETINLNSVSSFLRNDVNVINSADEECGTSVTEFYSNPSEGIVVNGIIKPRGSQRTLQWHSRLELPSLFPRYRPDGLNLEVVMTSTGKVFFSLNEFVGLKTEIGKPKLPSDVLNNQALEEANIRIYQGKETQLHLRGNIFEIPLFKDAKEGKFGGLSIVLVDADRILPEDIQSMPQEVQGHYSLYRKSVEETHQKLGIELAGLQESMNETEKEFRSGQLSSEKYDNVKKFYEGEKARLQEKIIKNQKPPVGIFMDGRKAARLKPEWVQDQPELAEGITIYLAVGGDFKPNPAQSHPKREQFPEDDSDRIVSFFTNGYRIQTEFVTPGYAMHHEVSHYESDSEYGADTGALERIGKGQYPFIFANSNGLTYTKQLETNKFASNI